MRSHLGDSSSYWVLRRDEPRKLNTPRDWVCIKSNCVTYFLCQASLKLDSREGIIVRQYNDTFDVYSQSKGFAALRGVGHSLKLGDKLIFVAM